PICKLKDITANALETINNVDLIAAEDTRVSINLLTHFEIKKKLISYHKFNENKQSDKLIDKLKQGTNIALITDAGTPCISDPGSILVKKAIENNINIYGIGGISALIVGLSVSGFNIESFAFYGFLPRQKKDLIASLTKINNDSSKIAIIYESPKRIINTLIKIQEYLKDPMICLGNDLTKRFERKYYGSCSKVIEELKTNENYELGEYVLIIEKHKKENSLKATENTIEADLINIIVKNKCTLKEAVDILAKNKKGSSTKKEVYSASLNLKYLFKE
ncbi:MAG: 16S rRNA (cytidine(1402)-2'-O)-methyltransferase, partial [Bacilli bacterium]|nr:16S rRNA (cytidine(1402)-2'-O)-methyltransferase [Bacilli bacterium]